MDKLEWKERTWVFWFMIFSLISYVLSCLLLSPLFAEEDQETFCGAMLLISIICIIVGITVLVIDNRDEDRYREIRKVFDAELRKRDDRLRQRQKGIREMVSRYKCLKTDYSILESKCAQLEAQNRELTERVVRMQNSYFVK